MSLLRFKSSLKIVDYINVMKGYIGSWGIALYIFPTAGSKSLLTRVKLKSR